MTAAAETVLASPDPAPAGIRAGGWFRPHDRAPFLDDKTWYYVFSTDRGNITYGMSPDARARITGPTLQNFDFGEAPLQDASL